MTVRKSTFASSKHAWITGKSDIPVFDIISVMEAGLDAGYQWDTGSIALWLWRLGELTEAPEGIAEPYRLIIDGRPIAAAERWAEIGCPYERAIALTHGDTTAQLEALETLGRHRGGGQAPQSSPGTGDLGPPRQRARDQTPCRRSHRPASRSPPTPRRGAVQRENRRPPLRVTPHRGSPRFCRALQARWTSREEAVASPTPTVSFPPDPTDQAQPRTSPDTPPHIPTASHPQPSTQYPHTTGTSERR